MLLLTLGEGHRLNIFILRGRPKDPPKAGIRDDQGNATLGSPLISDSVYSVSALLDIPVQPSSGEFAIQGQHIISPEVALAQARLKADGQRSVLNP
jgi:hypothetical protein